MKPALNGSAALASRSPPKAAVAAVAPSSLVNVLLRIGASPWFEWPAKVVEKITASPRGEERPTEAGRRIEADACPILGNQHEHQDGGKVWQHRHELRGNRQAEALDIEFEDADAAEEIGAKQQPQRAP